MRFAFFRIFAHFPHFLAFLGEMRISPPFFCAFPHFFLPQIRLAKNGLKSAQNGQNFVLDPKMMLFLPYLYTLAKNGFSCQGSPKRISPRHIFPAESAFFPGPCFTAGLHKQGLSPSVHRPPSSRRNPLAYNGALRTIPGQLRSFSAVDLS